MKTDFKQLPDRADKSVEERARLPDRMQEKSASFLETTNRRAVVAGSVEIDVRSD